MLKKNEIISIILYNFNKNYKINVIYNLIYIRYIRECIVSKVIHLNVFSKFFFITLKEIQIHPVNNKIKHITFKVINKKNPIYIPIRINIINKEKSNGFKKGGIFNFIKKFIILLCPPNNIIKNINIDVSSLDIGQKICINDIILPKISYCLIRKKNINFPIINIIGHIEDIDESK